MSTPADNVQIIAAALRRCSEALNGRALPVDVLPVGEPATFPAVNMTEGTEFIGLLNGIIDNTPAHEVESLQRLLFETNPHLVPIILSFLGAPQVVAPPEDLSRLLQSALNCLCKICCACCVDHIVAPSAESKGGSTHVLPNVSPAARQLSTLCADALLRNDFLPLLCSCLHPMLRIEIQLAAAETLFAFLMRSLVARERAASPKILRSILDCLVSGDSSSASDSNQRFRAYLTASLRELAGTFPKALSSPDIVELLCRLTAFDECSDVRALSIETIEVVVRDSPQAYWASRKRLATVIISRLEKDSESEPLVAILKLLETLILCDMNSAQRTSIAGAGKSAPTSTDDDVSFIEYFVSMFGERPVVQLIQPSSPLTSSLASKCLRLLVAHAPHFRFVAFNIFQHFQTLSKILKAVIHVNSIAAASTPTPTTSSNDAQAMLAYQVLRLELSVAFALMLSQDPRCRQLLKSQLAAHPEWMEQLRSAVIQSLNSTSLEYYDSIPIVDMTGTVLNRIQSVEWEEYSGSLRPTRSSIQKLLVDQEKRWRSTEDDEDQISSNAPQAEPLNVQAKQQAHYSRLTFIILTYSTHETLKTDAATVQPLVSKPDQSAQSPQSRFQSRYPQEHSSPGKKVGPSPTRTSLLRELHSHPDKLNALERAAGGQESIVSDSGPALPYDALQAEVQKKQAEKTHSKLFVDPRETLFSKFDNALKLVKQFAHFFERVPIPSSTKTIVYESTRDGFAKRQAKVARFPADNRSWDVQSLKEGDLFYFSVPFVSLSTTVMEEVRARAKRHVNRLNKAFIITPHVAKSRRWCLYDMVNHILPGVIFTLSQLLELFALHGEDNVKFPILMFREREIAEALKREESGGPCLQSHEVDNAALHCGNLVEVVDQTRFYFQRIGNYSTAPTSGSPSNRFALPKKSSLPSAGGDNVVVGSSLNSSSQYLDDLQRRIDVLSGKLVTGSAAADGHNSEDDLDNLASSDDDEISITEPMLRDTIRPNGRTERVEK